MPPGLYWRLEYRADDGQRWTIDMWLLERPASRGADAVARLGPLLTDDRRSVVCAVKEAALARQRRVSGLAVCHAVVHDGGQLGGVRPLGSRAAVRAALI
jgi:hypothetical protein